MGSSLASGSSCPLCPGGGVNGSSGAHSSGAAHLTQDPRPPTSAIVTCEGQFWVCCHLPPLPSLCPQPSGHGQMLLNLTSNDPKKSCMRSRVKATGRSSSLPVPLLGSAHTVQNCPRLARGLCYQGVCSRHSSWLRVTLHLSVGPEEGWAYPGWGKSSQDSRRPQGRLEGTTG